MLTMNPPERRHHEPPGPPPDNQRLLRAILRSRQQVTEQIERFERDIDNRFKMVYAEMRENKDTLLHNENQLAKKFEALEKVIKGEDDGGYIARVAVLEEKLNRNSESIRALAKWDTGLVIAIITLLGGLAVDLGMRIFK